jgi:NitT/TauT family transport system substrate-binding protein
MTARRLLLVLIIGSFIVISACSSCRNGNTPAATVSIGYSRLRISLPIFVAQEQKLFEKHGVSTTLVMYETAQPMMQALVEGKISVAGYTALPITFNGMTRSGQSLYFSTAMLEDQNHRISYLLKKKGSSIRGISDLRGKKIGILPTVAYKAWLQEILRANNVDLNTVVIQQVAPEIEVSSLNSGGIDALFTNDPMATAAIEAGAGEFITDFVEVPRYLGEPFLFGSFNARRDWADAHTKEFAGITAALDEAIEFIKQHPDEAKQYMAKYVPAQFANQVTRYPNSLYVPSTQTTKDMFEKEVESELKLGIISTTVNLEGLIYHAK